MTMDQKIDEVLGVVRENTALLRDHSEQLQEHAILIKKQGARLDELFHLFLDERKLNNDRFAQLASGFREVQKGMGELRTGLGAVDSKIDRVYESLSQDIQVFAEDLHQVKRRVTRLEKKSLS